MIIYLCIKNYICVAIAYVLLIYSPNNIDKRYPKLIMKSYVAIRASS